MERPDVDPSRLEELLRHRVTGIVIAAEGRAAQLAAGAERDAARLRRDAAEDVLEAIAAMQQSLLELSTRLAVTAARLEDAAEAADDGRVREAALATAEPATPMKRRRFARASMRDRPVAALFGIAAGARGL